MKELLYPIIAVAIIGTLGLAIKIGATASAQGGTGAGTSGEANQGSSYFVYQDTTPNLRAVVSLPGVSSDWGVQNPYKNANQSLIKSPQVFVKAAFQNIQTPAIYGLVRVAYNLQGLDCYTVFTGLAQLDGLRLQTYSSTSTPAINGGKGYVFEYYQDQKQLIVGSRVVCDKTYGLELMVVAPDQKQNGPLIQTILQNSQLTIPGSPAGK
jgi:hypothetical protein